MTDLKNRGNAALLILIRDGATSWELLCQHFGYDPVRLRTAESLLLHRIWDLCDAGIIEFPNDGRHPPSVDAANYATWRKMSAVEKSGLPSGEIRISSTWRRMQVTLGISLTQLAALESNGSMVVRPYFGDAKKVSFDLFVVMPFADTLQPVYADHITAVASELSMSVARADDFFISHSIVTDVWSAICSARLIIADCTGRNPNVFYEIGLAHAIGKPVVLVTQSPDDVPFDLRHLRYIHYALTPRGMRAFESALKASVSETLSFTGKEVIR